MALTQCRECGGQVSSESNQCPHCGAPVAPAAVRAANAIHGSSDGCFMQSLNGGCVAVVVFVLFVIVVSSCP